jgi:Ca2+-binding RTX toxin-like protein
MLGNDLIYGGDSNDEVYGKEGNDTIYGQNGNDTIEGNQNDDRIYGGYGNDEIKGDEGEDRIEGSYGDDTLLGGEGGDILIGGEGDDDLKGEGGINLIDGGAGNDFLVGGSDGGHIMYGGPGNDVMVGGFWSDKIEGGSGDDELRGGNGADTLIGGTGYDKLEGDEGSDLLKGNDGRDTLNGASGDDTLEGGAGNDKLFGEDGDDFLKGHSGRDHLDGGQGTDHLRAGSGNDVLIAVDGTPEIVLGADSINSGERDEYWIDWRDQAVNPVILNLHPDKRAVHVITAYRNYQVGNQNYQPLITIGTDDLPDPIPVAEHLRDSYKINHQNSPLYGEGGPLQTDVRQGWVGSCYFLARLASLAKTHPQYIRDMIADLGDGTYVVQFFNQSGNRVYVRVDADLWMTPGTGRTYADLTPGGGLWVALIEKAWAIHRYGDADYADINGGYSDTVNTSIALGLNNLTLSRELAPGALQFVQLMKTALAAGRSVVIGAPASLSDNTPMIPENYGFGQHVFAVHSIKVNSVGKPVSVKLYNPYGSYVEITNFDVLRYCVERAVILWPK